MAEYTVEEYRAGARRAMAAGNTAAAEELSQAGMALMASQAQPKQQSALSRTGEVAGDIAKSALSGAARGVRNVVQLPAMIGGTIDRGLEKIGLAPEGFAAQQREMSPLSAQNIGKAASFATGGGTDFRPETRAGRFAQTGADFATSGGLLGGVQGAVRYGLAPGIASEGAGQLTEGTALEPYARAAAAIGTSLVAAPRPGAFRRGASADDMATANRLVDSGVNPMSGQVSNSPRIMGAEGTFAPTGQQLDEFTAAALKTAGNQTATSATPTVLRQTQTKITDGMSDILKDVDVPITTQFGTRAMGVSDDYFAGTAGKDLPVSLRRVATEIIDAATTPGGASFPAVQMRKWRTIAGTHTTSAQEMTREAAHAIRSLIDDASEAALVALNRGDDVAALGGLRREYRNFLILADASTKGGREGARGVLTPERVATASKRTVGKTNYAMGRGTDLTELARDAEQMIGSASTVAPNAFRNVAIAGGGMSAGATVGGLLGGVPGAIAGAGAGAALPAARQLLARSNAMQTLLRDPAAIPRQSFPMLPGLLSQDRN